MPANSRWDLIRRLRVKEEKVEVKVSLEQATKAQRGGGGIVILFL